MNDLKIAAVYFVYFCLYLMLGGCASFEKPEDLTMVFNETNQQMVFSHKIDGVYPNKKMKDVWTSGCPEQGDCEDIALCNVEKLRKLGYNPHISWCSQKTEAWIMAKVNAYGKDWYFSHRHLTDFNHCPGKETGKCKQITFPNGRFSAAGSWICTWTDDKIKATLYKVEDRI